MKATQCRDDGCTTASGLLAVPNILGRGTDPRCYKHARDYFARRWLEHVRELHGLRHSLPVEMDDEIVKTIQRLESAVMIAGPRYASELPAWKEKP